ncbi:MAG TPA: ribbon-helix-helix domain-containing protein [Terracidiphilus sp.]|nr:ribbon-helix-helix domain-containing protein [Terracidiphilus sp.]
MRTTKVVSITLPPPLLEQAQALARQENRTMSELMREALRQYQRERPAEKTRTHMETIANETPVRTEDEVVPVIQEYRSEKKPVEQEAFKESAESNRNQWNSVRSLIAAGPPSILNPR